MKTTRGKRSARCSLMGAQNWNVDIQCKRELYQGYDVGFSQFSTLLLILFYSCDNPCHVFRLHIFRQRKTPCGRSAEKEVLRQRNIYHAVHLAPLVSRLGIVHICEGDPFGIHSRRFHLKSGIHPQTLLAPLAGKDRLEDRGDVDERQFRFDATYVWRIAFRYLIRKGYCASLR